jgi:hypothetical protein
MLCTALLSLDQGRVHTFTYLYWPGMWLLSRSTHTNISSKHQMVVVACISFIADILLGYEIGLYWYEVQYELK